MIPLSGDGFAVTLVALDRPMDDEYLALNGNVPLTRCSNKFKPLLETRSARPFACPQGINPRWFLKVQRKVASRRWRRSGKLLMILSRKPDRAFPRLKTAGIGDRAS
jgi:hypothetical protein